MMLEGAGYGSKQDERISYDEAKFSGRADDSPHDGGSHSELYQSHHANDPDSAYAPVVPIPTDVQHMAVLYPRGGTPDWSNAYGRLESAAFQLKTFRPNLRIIDRSHMQAIISEQRFQVGELVSENSAARIGQLLGVDSVLIYQIDGPTLRDRFFARQHYDLPPVTITTKTIRVESGEVIYHNVVTAHLEETEG